MGVHGCAWIDLRHAMMVDECNQSVLHRGQQRGALFTNIIYFTTGVLLIVLCMKKINVKLEKKRRKKDKHN